MYQSTVCLSPSSSEMRGAHPSERKRLTSGNLRGVPSVLGAVPLDRASEADNFGYELGNLTYRKVHAGAYVDRLR